MATGGHARLPALTGVRALAAFLVFFHHHPTELLEVGPLRLWWELHIGVTLFFVLSGFMITWRYDRRGPAKESFLRGYFVNRFARIYPLYFFLVVPTMLIYGARSLSAWFWNLTVFSSLEVGIPQAWSLRVEECFYLCAPLLFLLWRRHTVLPLVAAAAVLIALYPIAKIPSTSGIVGPPANMLLYTFPGRFFEFYVGIWLAKKVARAGPNIDPHRRFPVFTLGGLLGIVGVVVALAAIYSATGGRYVYGLYHPAGIALNNLVLPLAIAAFYWGLVRERSPIRWILSTRVADLLGRSSYAFYLIHLAPVLNILLTVLVAVVRLFGTGVAGAFENLLLHNVAVLFAVVTLLSIALYEAVERPANRFVRRRFGSSAPAAVAPSPSTA